VTRERGDRGQDTGVEGYKRELWVNKFVRKKIGGRPNANGLVAEEGLEGGGARLRRPAMKGFPVEYR